MADEKTKAKTGWHKGVQWDAPWRLIDENDRMVAEAEENAGDMYDAYLCLEQPYIWLGQYHTLQAAKAACERAYAARKKGRRKRVSAQKVVK